MMKIELADGTRIEIDNLGVEIGVTSLINEEIKKMNNKKEKLYSD